MSAVSRFVYSAAVPVHPRSCSTRRWSAPTKLPRRQVSWSSGGVGLLV